VTELGLEHDGLDGVEAAVDALDLVNVLLDGPVAGEQASVPGEIVIVGDERSAVPVGSEVLPGVEAERPGDAERPGLAALEGREMGLGAVLDEVELVLVANRLDGVEVGRLAEEVDGSMWKYSSMSTKTGLAPVWEMVSDVAMKLLATVMTSSPGPTPRALRVM
jgi:hypothetical protein